ncbi:MAG: ATP-binding protein [Pseudomonadota bacterium]
MSLLTPPSPLNSRRVSSAGPVLVMGGAAVAAVALLVLVAGAHPVAGALLAAALAGLAGVQAARAREKAALLREEVAQTHAQVSAGEPSLPYTAVINALPDPVMVISAYEPDDLTGRRFVLVNLAARDVLKIQRDAGLLVTAIRDPDVLEAVDEALFGALAGEAIYEPGGTQERIFRAYASPLGMGTDGGRLALLVLHDETEIRRVERMRADFLANASHELRTPLASLSGFIETLRGHARADEGAREKFLGIMQVQAERMSRLIDDLMSLSRIELNEHVAPDQEVDLAAAVSDVVDAVAPIAQERKIRMAVELPSRGTVKVVGDRDQIVQVAQNLVDNAMKYSSPDGEVRVRLEWSLSADAAAAGRMENAARLPLLTPDHGPERYAALSVSDDGPGMAREHLPRLTERFYRVEGQKSGEKSGTGLGLAIVKHIMNRHRGGLVVESALGRGATFTAYFPVDARKARGEAPLNKPSDVAKVS